MAPAPKRVTILANESVVDIEKLPTEQFVWSDSHKEELLLWKYRVRMSRMHYSHYENEYFAKQRAEHLLSALSAEHASDDGNKPYTVQEQVPWAALVQIATGNTIDVIRSRKRAPRMGAASGQKSQPSLKKKVCFSQISIMHFEFIPTEQCVFTQANKSKLNTFNARVRMSRMFQHDINEEQASRRASDCRADVERETEEVSFLMPDESPAWDESSKSEMNTDSEFLKGFAVLDDASSSAKCWSKHEPACKQQPPAQAPVAPTTARKTAPWEGLSSQVHF